MKEHEDLSIERQSFYKNDLSKKVFDTGTISFSSLYKCDISDSFFKNFEIEFSTFEESKLDVTSFSQTKISFTQINYHDFYRASFIDTTNHFVDFFGSTFWFCDFLSSKFKNCRFSQCIFVGCRMDYVKFYECDISSSYFIHTSFLDSTLKNCISSNIFTFRSPLSSKLGSYLNQKTPFETETIPHRVFIAVLSSLVINKNQVEGGYLSLNFRDYNNLLKTMYISFTDSTKNDFCSNETTPDIFKGLVSTIENTEFLFWPKRAEIMFNDYVKSLSQETTT